MANNNKKGTSYCSECMHQSESGCLYGIGKAKENYCHKFEQIEKGKIGTEGGSDRSLKGILMGWFSDTFYFLRTAKDDAIPSFSLLGSWRHPTTLHVGRGGFTSTPRYLSMGWF